jgi:hypothetical protein
MIVMHLIMVQLDIKVSVSLPYAKPNQAIRLYSTAKNTDMVNRQKMMEMHVQNLQI